MSGLSWCWRMAFHPSPAHRHHLSILVLALVTCVKFHACTGDQLVGSTHSVHRADARTNELRASGTSLLDIQTQADLHHDKGKKERALAPIGSSDDESIQSDSDNVLQASEESRQPQREEKTQKQKRVLKESEKELSPQNPPARRNGLGGEYESSDVDGPGGDGDEERGQKPSPPQYESRDVGDGDEERDQEPNSPQSQSLDREGANADGNHVETAHIQPRSSRAPPTLGGRGRRGHNPLEALDDDTLDKLLSALSHNHDARNSAEQGGGEQSKTPSAAAAAPARHQAPVPAEHVAHKLPHHLLRPKTTSPSVPRLGEKHLPHQRVPAHHVAVHVDDAANHAPVHDPSLGRVGGVPASTVAVPLSHFGGKSPAGTGERGSVDDSGDADMGGDRTPEENDNEEDPHPMEQIPHGFTLGAPIPLHMVSSLRHQDQHQHRQRQQQRQRPLGRPAYSTSDTESRGCEEEEGHPDDEEERGCSEECACGSSKGNKPNKSAPSARHLPGSHKHGDGEEYHMSGRRKLSKHGIAAHLVRVKVGKSLMHGRGSRAHRVQGGASHGARSSADSGSGDTDSENSRHSGEHDGRSSESEGDDRSDVSRKDRRKGRKKVNDGRSGDDDEQKGHRSDDSGGDSSVAEHSEQSHPMTLIVVMPGGRKEDCLEKVITNVMTLKKDLKAIQVDSNFQVVDGSSGDVASSNGKGVSLTSYIVDAEDTGISREFSRPLLEDKAIRIHNYTFNPAFADDDRPLKQGTTHLIVLPEGAGNGASKNFALSKVETPHFMIVDGDIEVDIHSTVGLHALLHSSRRRSLDSSRAQHNHTGSGHWDIIGGTVSQHGNKTFYCPRVEFGDGAYEEIQNEDIAISRAAEHRVVDCDKVVNYFVANTQKVRTVGWDENLRFLDHYDFFIRAKRARLSVGGTQEVVAERRDNCGECALWVKLVKDEMKKDLCYLAEKFNVHRGLFNLGDCPHHHKGHSSSSQPSSSDVDGRTVEGGASSQPHHSSSHSQPTKRPKGKKPHHPSSSSASPTTSSPWFGNPTPCNTASPSPPSSPSPPPPTSPCQQGGCNQVGATQ